jgi:hypothetical protein
MAANHKQTTSLWSVIERMQSRLEAEGLDRDVVDAAVATGLQALLDFAPPTRVQPPTARRAARSATLRLPLWARSRASVKI